MSSSETSPKGKEQNRDVRHRILVEATRLFGDHGFKGTSLQAVADAVGLKKPSLLYHFSSKDAIRQEVIESLFSHWKNEIPKLLTAARSGHSRFSSTITALVGFFEEDRSRAKLALREILDRPETIRAIVKEHLRPWAPLLIEYLRMGQQAGVVKATVDPESYLVQVIIMVVGTVAIGDVAGAMVESDSDNHLESRIAELVRIAQDSLFNSPMKEQE